MPWATKLKAENMNEDRAFLALEEAGGKSFKQAWMLLPPQCRGLVK